MTFWDAIGRQLRRPQGVGGRAVGHLMRIVNARPYALAIAALDPKEQEQILDLGCGPGHGVALVAARMPHGQVYGIDQSPTMLAQARRRNRKALESGQVRLSRASFDKLPIRNRSIDGVLAVNVVYFWRDDAAILGELRRVLRPGGRLFIYVTDEESMRLWPFTDRETHRLFNERDLADLLRHGGFHDDLVTVQRIAILPHVTGLLASAQSPL